MANSYAFVLSKNTYPDAWQANFLGVDQGTMIVYASTDTLSSSTVLFADSRLTQPIYGNPDLWLGAQLLTDDSVKYAVAIGGSGTINPVSNPTTTTSSTSTTSTSTTSTSTTTTTTTAAPSTFTLASLSSSNPSLACLNGFGGGTELVYASTNNGASVTRFFTNSGLTTPFVGDGNAYLFQFSYPSGVNYAAYIDGSGNVTGNTAC